MELEQYELMYHQEDRHWWYVGMRRITEMVLDRHSPVSAAPGEPWEILDAGCGSGGTTAALARRGRVTGVDLEPRALHLARTRRLPRLVRGSVDCLPFASGRFDLVTSFDVIYHLGVQDDSRALREFHRVLRPGGILLIRVPAYDWIRGAHDAAVHTRHRYGRSELASKLRMAGLTLLHLSYANSLLFPLAPAKRLLERSNGGGRVTDLWRPPGPLNRLLADVLGLEGFLVASSGIPWGLSLYAVARRD